MSRTSPRVCAVIAVVSLLASVSPSGAASSARTIELGGTTCNLIPVPKASTAGPLIPVGTVPCPGVRPGALLTTDIGLCSFNFLFRGGDGARYMGTAGHCILGDGPFAEDAGEKVWAAGAGPIVRDGAGAIIGRFVYAILQGEKDFALVRLNSGVSASASMCYFGGPTGINTSTAQGPVVLHHFGNGLLIGDVLPARTHVTLGMPSPDHVFAYGAAMLGDSGSGVIDSNGRAVGVLVTVGAHIGGVFDHGVIGITRLKPQVDRAASQIKTTLTLQTATF